MTPTVVYAFAFLALVNGIHGQHNNGETKPIICNPGTMSKVDCNNCKCSLDGTALACTRMACPKIPPEYLNPDGSIKVPLADNALLRNKRDQVCKPGTTRDWECNKCRCSSDGTAEVCTKRACPNLPRERRQVVTKCTPNESFMDDCNQCHCSSDGRVAACTLMACTSLISPIFNPDGSIRRPHQNNPLLRTKRDQVCKPNTMRVWECNNCRCSSDGTQEICTRRVCPIVPRHRRDAPLQCVPNQNFKRDCNTCVCSANGRSAMCTLMACVPQNLLNHYSRPELVT